ncbi:prepilin-type N-terminal cleavage/methylation domain-containing protein [Luteimonas terrae]|uniref:Prepilin-type N-terminal cleavage/methylation domain-containing protein n=1 Tax=Luteimonas terrae TaxID=1530191 RepID=A0A4R5UFJ5_9GAMM|nr:prepilin-type N-terminal cleavage/methylation domain-containing protein [Luteimonas terrae]
MPASQRGLSLIEIMVALLIGSLLLLGLIQVFSASRVSYQLSTGLARSQENARFAMDFLQRDLRMAGHLGCVNDQARFLPENTSGTRLALASTFETTPGAGTANRALRFDIGIEGYEYKVPTSGGFTLAATPATAPGRDAWAPAPDTDLFGRLNNPVVGSDIVVLRYFAPTGAQMESFNPAASPVTISVTNTQLNRLTDGVASPGLFGISDCMNAAVFQATSFAGNVLSVGVGNENKVTLSGNESFVRGQARVYRAESVVYYVGRNGNGTPSLYRLRFNAAPGAALTSQNEELVEGVESLHFRYGQDSRTASDTRPTGNVGSYQTADAVQPATDLVTAWRRVAAVELGIVVRSTDSAAAQQRVATVTQLSVLGVQITPPDDRRYRAVYEDSVAFRNRLFGN